MFANRRCGRKTFFCEPGTGSPGAGRADDLRDQAVQKTDETLRKTRQTVRDAYSDLVTTGGELGSEALSRAKEGGEKASQTVRKRVRQGIRDVENSDW